MALSAGTRLGSYEILAAIGAGGMGEVYRARDTKLNRDVAIKVLPDSLAADPDRLARFQREARLLASLNHPHIAHIHGLEESDGIRALVMELIEGEDLAALIARGPIPIDEALPIARQIVEALEAAHGQAIVHRDLKPANIKVRADGIVKVLDFGLAKLAGPAEAGHDDSPGGKSQSPTLTSPAMATHAGIILGTAAYMSPEQAKGKPVDKRTDVWAFGCVLYEMLTRKRAFEGEDVSDTLAAILRGEPDWNAMPPTVPPHVRAVIKGCLQKDGKARIAEFSTVRFLMAAGASELAVVTGQGTPPAPRRHMFAIAGAGVLAVAAIAAIFALEFTRQPVLEPLPVRFTVPPPANTSFGALSGNPAMSLSPDGRHLVFTAITHGGGSGLWVRGLDEVEARALPGTLGAIHPFWSPGGESIGFFADGKLKSIGLGGGSAQTLCDAPALYGGSWNRDGIILFAGNSEGLFQVSAAGGQPARVTTVDSAQERSHRWPQFLPDGRHFLYVSAPATATASKIVVASLDSREIRSIGETTSNAILSGGYLLFARQATLFAQPFDANRAEITGAAVPISEDIRTNLIGENAAFAVSASGTLAFRTATSSSAELLWFDRAGKALNRLADAAPYLQLQLSPDGKQVAVQRDFEVWLMDATRGAPARFNDVTGGAVWSPDSRELAYAARQGIVHQSLSGGAEQAVAPGLRGIVEDWSLDGRYLVYLDLGDIWALPLAGDRKPLRITATTGVEDEPQVSPDGRWLAYMSPESGGPEIYVQPFPGPGERKRISTGGGVQPKWRRDGRELFYLTLDGTLIALELKTAAAIEPGSLQPLFQTRLNASSIIDQYAVTADGQKFLILKPLAGAAESPITVVVNWTSALKR